jgi:N-acetylglucosamine kinase-like BadF-type ATPase
MKIILGVDGGGTRTRARLADEHGKMLGTGQAGSSNMQAQGPQAAQQEILSAIAKAFASAGLPPSPICAACLGLAGAARPDERELMLAWAKQAIGTDVILVSDVELVLAAGTPALWGIGLIAGTGSIAWGRTQDGRVARAGGWGYLLGDEGSAYDLAREALRAAAQAADGRATPTALLDAVLQYWQLPNPQAMIAKVYRPALSRTEVAQLAPLVIAQAMQGDGVACAIVQRGAQALAQAVLAVAQALALQGQSVPLALTGGLLLNAAMMREQVLQHLDASDFRFDPIKLVHEPVEGAVRLAQKKRPGQ